MGIQFFDHPDDHVSLLPLTYTRPIAELRVGIFTIREKWLFSLKSPDFGYATEEYLAEKFPPYAVSSSSLWINASLLPDEKLVDEILKLTSGDSLFYEETIIASKGIDFPGKNQIEFSGPVSRIKYPWDIFLKNGEEIRKDIKWVSHNTTSTVDDPFTKVYGSELYIESGAKIKAAILNTETGPIYIGKNADVQEGSIIRGPVALCEGSIISLGAKIRPDSTIGPYSKVGGEFSNSVILGYSNKAHDGFLGNSVIGEWCNLGADTNNSNLKNNYGEVKMWNYSTHEPTGTGLQFCGLIMGDYSKCGINTMFNTGTSIGVGCNIYGGGFPPTIIPSFSWGGSGGLTTHRLQEALETNGKVLSRRKMEFPVSDKRILQHIFNETLSLRH